MPRRPSTTHRRTAVIRGAAAILIVGTVLGLVLWLPIDRATLVVGMITSLVTSIAPVWLNTSRSTPARGRRRSSSYVRR